MPIDHSRPWWTLPLILLDFETTGVDPLECAPVSVGAVRLEDGREVGSFYSLLNPRVSIPEGASAIHGITDDHVRDAPLLEDLADHLYELAGDAVPCGYNAQTYDRVILHRYIRGTDCPLFDPSQRWIDPLVMVRKIDRFAAGSGRHQLGKTCARWEIDLGDAHNALADVRATARLLVKLIDSGKVRPDVTLGRLLDYTDELRAKQQADFDAYRARMEAQKAAEAEQEELLSAFAEPG